MPLSVDIESLSTKTDCVILQVGIVQFEYLVPGIIPIFNGTFNSQMQKRLGFTHTKSNLDWWHETAEKEAIYNRISEEGLQEALYNQVEKLYHILTFALTRDTDRVVWARGPQFDIKALEHLFEKFHKETPWHYNRVADSRTVFRTAKTLIPSWDESDWDNDKFGVQHDAYNDAYKEAFDIQRAFGALQCKK